MTQNRDLKRLIRARMAETGESYTTARSHILRRRHTARSRAPACVLEAPRLTGPGSARIDVRGRRAQLARRRSRTFPWLSIVFSAPALLLFIAAVLLGCTSPAGENQHVTVSTDAVHVVGAPEVIARITDLEPTHDGRVWLLNSIEPFFVVVGPDGRVEREFGQAGDGPAEFGAPLALVYEPESGAVWTYDLLRHALIELSSREMRSLRLPQDSLAPSQLVSFAGAGAFPARPWMDADSGGILLARVRPGTAPPFSGLGLWNADIVRVRADSTAALEVHMPVADFVGEPGSRYPRATKILPYPLWTICADGTVALYHPIENELRRIAPDGRVLMSIALPDEQRVELTFDRMFAIAYRHAHEEADGPLPDSVDMRRQFTAMFSEWQPESADVFPEYADLQCARDGSLWLQPFNVTTGVLGRGPDWYRFSPEGSRTRVTLPQDFRPYRIEPNRIWGTVRDSLGITSVAWIEMETLK